MSDHEKVVAIMKEITINRINLKIFEITLKLKRDATTIENSNVGSSMSSQEDFTNIASSNSHHSTTNNINMPSQSNINNVSNGDEVIDKSLFLRATLIE